MRFLSVFTAALLIATAAEAHSGDSSASGGAHDLLHFLGGADHTWALVSVGLLFLLIALAPLASKALARNIAAAKALFATRRSDRS